MSENKKKERAEVRVLPKAPDPQKRGQVEVSQEIAGPISCGKVEGFVLVGIRGEGPRNRSKVYTVEGPEHLLDKVAELAAKAVE